MASTPEQSSARPRPMRHFPCLDEPINALGERSLSS